MNFTKLPIFALLTERMGWLGTRQSVLAENVANANTPKYWPKELKAQSFDEILRLQPGAPDVPPVTTLTATHPNHIQPFVQPPDPDIYTPTPAAADIKGSGNAVVLEEELTKVGKTAMDYQLMTNLYGRAVNMIRTAIGRGSAR